MIITCEACGTSFKIKSSLVKETGSTVRCSKCQHVFIAYPNAPMDGSPADFKSDEALEAKIDDALGQEFEDDFSDLESEITLETADIPVATADELFESAATRRKDREERADETEILMSDLEQDDDIISLESLESGATAEENLEEWLEKPESESDIISYGELGAKSTVEDTSEIVSIDALGSTADEDFVDLGDLESGATEPDETTSEEEEVDFLDFDDETASGQNTAELAENEIEMELDENLKDTAELTEIEPEAEELEIETKGGVDKDLDAFDLEKGSEDDTSKGTAKKAGEKAEAEKPAQDVSKEEEEFELDFDLEEEPAEVSKASAKADEFDLDLDFAADGKKESQIADDLGLDLEGFEDLDLAEEPAGKATARADFDLDLSSGEDLEAEDLGLDLDIDKELADIDSGTMGGDDFSLDFDLDDKAEKSSKAKADDEFDLDFDFEAKAEPGAGEEDFELDLNIEPEPVKAEAQPDEFDLDLDFDDGLGDESSLASVEAEKGTKRKTEAEELDLTQIEDVLDFDAMPEPEEAGQDDLKDLGMDASPHTVSEDEEMSIDLETMLEDEEAPGVGKEVSLETVEEREQEIEKTYRKTVVEKQKELEDAGEYLPEEETFLEQTRTVEKPYAPPVMAESRNLKKILVPLIILIVLGAVAIGAWMLFGGKEEAPVTPVTPAVIDQGNLRMEMIAEPAYQFVENEAAGELLVVTGNVTNRYDHPRSRTMVKGVLYDSAGTVIVTASAYAGNMLTDADLTGLDQKTLTERLNNRGGDNNANIGLAPGNKIPFTVVFSNLPENISELTVEVVQSEK